MIVITTAAPPPPTPFVIQTQARRVLPQPLTCIWYGADGSTWDLTNDPNVRLKKGVRGFGAAPPIHYRTKSPTIPGGHWQGMNTDTGEVFLPVGISGTPDRAFFDADSAFAASVLSGDMLGRLRIIRPDGQWREVACRYESGLEGDYQDDPGVLGPALYGITFTTEDAYWYGDTVSAAFPFDTPRVFFPGPPWNINPSRSLSSATVTNLGDVDTYAVWKISPPYSGFTVGVGTSVVTMALGHTATGSITINADPNELTMLDGAGNDVWHYATEEDLAGMAIPPGQSVPLTTSLTGASAGSQVSVSFTPRYRRST